MFSKLEFWCCGFSLGQPGGSGGPSRHKGAEAVCMSVRYPLAGAWRELQLRTSAVGWRGGMPGVYSRDYASLTHPNAYRSAGFISAELDFLDSVPSWGPGKTQNSSSERMLSLALVGLHVF